MHCRAFLTLSLPLNKVNNIFFTHSWVAKIAQYCVTPPQLWKGLMSGSVFLQFCAVNMISISETSKAKEPRKWFHQHAVVCHITVCWISIISHFCNITNFWQIYWMANTAVIRSKIIRSQMKPKSDDIVQGTFCPAEIGPHFFIYIEAYACMHGH